MSIGGLMSHVNWSSIMVLVNGSTAANIQVPTGLSSHVNSRPVTKSIPNRPRQKATPVWPEAGVSSCTQPLLP